MRSRPAGAEKSMFHVFRRIFDTSSFDGVGRELDVTGIQAPLEN